MRNIYINIQNKKEVKVDQTNLVAIATSLAQSTLLRSDDGIGTNIRDPNGVS